MNKPIIISSGEPSGVGPDIVISSLSKSYSTPILVFGNIDLIQQRAHQLGYHIKIKDYDLFPEVGYHEANTMWIKNFPLRENVKPGILNKENASYVLSILKEANNFCLTDRASALVTAPVHKGIINEAGIPFTGHTEYLANVSDTQDVVMMLASPNLRVALVTTHIPLKDVPAAINKDKFSKVTTILNDELKSKFGILKPKIFICGLNPHAGENGHLGLEEKNVLIPEIQRLQVEGIHAIGPLPADTIFQPKIIKEADAFLAMYHDQGLPVLKFDGFGNAVNITLGLPYIRTSVDHGTAIEIAGKGVASDQSLKSAISYAINMVNKK
ncbi:4-hydroxythreonine-4-phosphate dehydrogenase PdxA [Paraphotobacterium marinum]|nr:4-hydroxythreonine-4-phosphate dehydrogenase PdxA [Paraphotobacterium marinum]